MLSHCQCPLLSAHLDVSDELVDDGDALLLAGDGERRDALGDRLEGLLVDRQSRGGGHTRLGAVHRLRQHLGGGRGTHLVLSIYIQ